MASVKCRRWRRDATASIQLSNGKLAIMQSIFSVAARRRKLLRDITDAERRAGALKMDWTEPLHDAGPMCIEWLAEG
jgi:hypothetical protein